LNKHFKYCLQFPAALVRLISYVVLNPKEENSHMNKKLIAGLSTVLIGISACSTTPAPSAETSVTTLSNTERYQATVNAQAAVNGVEVHWVNPPDENDLKKYSKSDAATNGPTELD
jgi:ABC-type glycerol-3-phosphate transport system substrate-binding protein